MKNKIYNYLLAPVSLLFVLILTNSLSAGVYQEPEVFLQEVFDGDPPRADKLWIRSGLKEQIRQIIGHDLDVLRLHYWRDKQRTAWVLEEIGKEKLITVGIVVNDGEIERLKVLIFRESRGWEVRYPFFTEQFKGVMLDQKYELSKGIDGISGATLSVRALTRLARLALFLHEQSISADEGSSVDK